MNPMMDPRVTNPQISNCQYQNVTGNGYQSRTQVFLEISSDVSNLKPFIAKPFMAFTKEMADE